MDPHKGNRVNSRRPNWRGGWMTLPLLCIVGCGAPGELENGETEEGAENVGSVEEAITLLPGDFSRNTPTFQREFFDAHTMATLVGNGYNSHVVAHYQHATNA